MHDVSVEVNGRRRSATVERRTTLADFLRERCGLTGTHLGCGRAREALSGNLCRCTGYQGILRAARLAADAGTPA